ncbi:MAG: ATP-binding protein [Bdellovibrionales bacterium]
MASLKSKILGHEDQLHQWSRLLQEGRLTGAFLFVGPPGVGKMKAAWAFAQEALCENRAQAPCGACGSCRRVEHHQHESVLMIQPDGAQIKVEQAHQVLEFLHLQSLNTHRFVLIDEASKLNPAAANSLLKTLEEPPEGTTLILTAPSVSSVLPTIRSRSRVFHFTPVAPELMLRHQVAAEWAIWASQGRFDRLTALGNSESRELRQKWAQFLVEFLLGPEMLTEETWRDKLKNRDEVRAAVEIWLGLIRDALFLQQGEQKSLLNLDLKSVLAQLSQIPTEVLHRVGQSLLQFQKELSFNKDAVLSLESLYIQTQRESIGR